MLFRAISKQVRFGLLKKNVYSQCKCLVRCVNLTSFRAVHHSSYPNPKLLNVRKASAITASVATVGILTYLLGEAFEDGIPVSEIKLHNKVDDCWIVLNGEVYDVTAFLKQHPGGAARILEVAGQDATDKFHEMHSDAILDKVKGKLIYIGKMKGQFYKELTAEEIRIMDMKSKLPPLSSVFSISDFEAIAKQVLPKSSFMYFATGASDEFTLRENHYAYSRVFFRPKILQDTNTDVDTSTNFLGAKVNIPIYITAFAGSKLADPIGEMHLQAASYDANVMHMVPKQNSYSVDDFFDVVPEDQNHWMQFHFDTEEEKRNVDQFLRTAESLPSVKGVFFNVDLPDIGNREKDSRQRASTDGYHGLDEMTPNQFGQHPRLAWKDIEKIISSTSLPVALKGVQRGEDVVLAAEKGIKAVVLSNHGGRQLDFSRPPLEVLVEAKEMLREKNLEDKIEIYVDGGIRRGSDVVKALCLGATGVGLGRPFLYAMAGYGEDGVAKLIDILETEIKNNMRLLGVDKIEDLNESFVDARNLKLRNPRIADSLYDEAYQPLTFPEFR